MFDIFNGNYWLNMILFEELIEELYDYFKPMKRLSFKDDFALKTEIYIRLDKFFKDSKNNKYTKFHPHIKYRFTVIFVTDEMGEYCRVDSIYFGA